MAVLKASVPLFLLLGSVFLAMASVSVGLAYWEKQNPEFHVCLKSCEAENDSTRYLACHARCKLTNAKDPQRARQGEEEKGHDPHDPQQEQPQPHREREEEEEEERSSREHEEEQRRREERHHREERERGERERGREKEEQQKEREEPNPLLRRRNRNPFHFDSDRFETRFKNEHGRIRVLQRFDRRSKHLRGLQKYRVVEFESRPETLILPHHSDSDYLLVVHAGRAIFTVVFENNRESYQVEEGDALLVPAGAIAYVANRDHNQNLRITKLVIPLNIPGQFEDFYPSGNQNPRSYYRAFSRETLEATFNAQYDEIERVLLGEEGQGEKQSSGEGAIVKLSREQVRALSRHAKSSPRGGRPSRLGPFSFRNLQPLYSNNHGKFWEARPQEFQPLQDLGISITFTDLNQGSLFIPHYNTRAIVVAYVVNGTGRLEIGSPHIGKQREESEGEEQQLQDEDEEEQSEGQIQTASSRLSQGDVFVVLASHPIALTASEDNNLRAVGFALNAQNNQRNFLAGERDNVINQIAREVKEVTFQGSSEQVERLFRNQRESYFVNADQQRRGRNGKMAPLSSILGALF